MKARSVDYQEKPGLRFYHGENIQYILKTSTIHAKSAHLNPSGGHRGNTFSLEVSLKTAPFIVLFTEFECSHCLDVLFK